MSQLFGILALQFEGPSSFFDNFSALVFSFTFRSQFFLQLLRHFVIPVSHTGGSGDFPLSAELEGECWESSREVPEAGAEGDALVSTRGGEVEAVS
ncbi:hypothetical protein RIR_jg40429.t1 [Rhizophagus irregularis DAOM 181602=DAOM 197198]|uniref:Uncharacterized protein n=1 Tax=Rhizophagus irregularis (strain DAOM 197198w) TaxID=1432141 RepID=A0A015I2M1_RHIIW|nr:hypothetical protein RirG_263580 [Rhizophagus irregularis DAOM 197198w]GBC54266.1 hypothetical protein RIR_jg40429.t1 [Rhizophagus irregularis DAOM 181602=DAOM 197198]